MVRPCAPRAAWLATWQPLVALLLVLAVPGALAATSRVPHAASAEDKPLDTTSRREGSARAFPDQRSRQLKSQGPEWRDARGASLSRRHLRALAKAAPRTAVKWPAVTVVTAGGPSAFGWVSTVGSGIAKATAAERTCVELSTWTRGGTPFDQVPQQKSFFVAYMTAEPFRLIADVAYDPAKGVHTLCYAAPSAGNYTLDVRLVFTNTDNLTSEVNPENAGGFANYTRVLVTTVHVTGPKGFDPVLHRVTLPVCTTALLAHSRSAGFWFENEWFPATCRLTRLSPPQALQCLSGRNVLMVGDSETRITYGFLQTLLQFPTRRAFFDRFQNSDFFYGDMILHTLKGEGIAEVVTPQGPPLDAATGKARRIQYDFASVPTTFFGSIYEGFTRQRVRSSVQDPVAGTASPVDFNLTYSSLFTVGGGLFSPWKTEGRLTDGVTVDGGAGGGKFDLVFLANQLHDVRNFENATDYAQRLTGSFLQKVLLPRLASKGSLVMWGGLSSMEARKLGDAHASGNPRIAAFEEASWAELPRQGWPHFLRMQPITAPRPDLAFDSTHYTWPVSLAVVDLWLGSTCPAAEQAL